MAKTPSPRKPEPPPLQAWDIHRVAHRLIFMGEVEAADEHGAITKGADRFRVPATKLMATPRR